MKTRALIIGIAMLLASGTAHSGDSKSVPKPSWVIDCRKAEIQYDGDDDDDARRGHLTLKDVREIEKLAPYLKKCEAFWECVKRRGTKWPDGSAWVYPPAGTKWGTKQSPVKNF